jgi:hypothetical protein
MVTNMPSKENVLSFSALAIFIIIIIIFFFLAPKYFFSDTLFSYLCHARFMLTL